MTEDIDYNPPAIRAAFRFLVDKFGLTIVRDVELNNNNGRPSSYQLEYRGNNRQIRFSHDYQDHLFNLMLVRFSVVSGKDKIDPDDVLDSWRLFKMFEPDLGIMDIQPRGKTCAEAANLNAQYLRKYGAEILRGETWVVA